MLPFIASDRQPVTSAEIPPYHIGVCGTVMQLWAAEAELGELPETSWVALRPGGSEEAIVAVFYRDADAGRVASRLLPGGAAVLAPGSRMTVAGDGFGRASVRAEIPGGAAMRLSPEGAEWLPADSNGSAKTVPTVGVTPPRKGLPTGS